MSSEVRQRVPNTSKYLYPYPQIFSLFNKLTIFISADYALHSKRIRSEFEADNPAPFTPLTYRLELDLGKRQTNLKKFNHLYDCIPKSYCLKPPNPQQTQVPLKLQ